MEGKPLAAIDDLVLAEFLSARRADGVRPSTVRRDLACLSSMFSIAIERKMIDRNPVPTFLRAWKKRGLKESPPRRRWLREWEEEALLQKCTPEVRQAVCVAIDTGLRREELFSLRPEQINWSSNQIELTTGTKNARAREVPLLARSAAILRERIRPVNDRQPAYVWINPDTGTRYTQLNKGLKAAARRAKIAPVTWHDLRRTCGCRLLQRHAMSMAQVARWLGHSSVLVTERAYAFLETEHLHQHIAEQGKSQKRSQDSGFQG